MRDDENAWKEQRPPFIRYDLKLSLSRNKKKTTRTWELDIQNITNNDNVAGDWYNSIDEEITTYSQLGILPVLSYKVTF